MNMNGTKECLTKGWVETGKIRPDASASPPERVTRTSHPSTKVDRLFSYMGVKIYDCRIMGHAGALS